MTSDIFTASVCLVKAIKDQPVIIFTEPLDMALGGLETSIQQCVRGQEPEHMFNDLVCLIMAFKSLPVRIYIGEMGEALSLALEVALEAIAGQGV